MRIDKLLTLLMTILIFSGCGDESGYLNPESYQESKSQDDSPPPSPSLDEKAEEDLEKTNTTEPRLVEESETIETEAKAGSGKKGRDYGGGIVTEPIRQHFIAGDRLVFSVQIPQALKLYKAQDPNGKGPQTHEEFMEKIIQANGIKLPPLPAGHNYFYDPKTETLMDQYKKE